jgi:selenide,water dikinase
MGGVAKTAMNIVAYPMQKLGKDILRAVLSGGIEKLKEAETVLIGGHSIEDDDFKYGLSVTGFVHPQHLYTNKGLRLGDCLILTKPLGTGIINTAIKGGLASSETILKVTDLMAELNKNASEVMKSYPVTACTDITGFGLLGHLSEMVFGTDICVTIESRTVPILPEASEFAAMGFVPAGAHRNRSFRQEMVKLAPDISPIMRDVLFDPQTSGGLLIGCPDKHAPELKKDLIAKGVKHAAIIGKVFDKEKELINIV